MANRLRKLEDDRQKTTKFRLLPMTTRNEVIVVMWYLEMLDLGLLAIIAAFPRLLIRPADMFLMMHA